MTTTPNSADVLAPSERFYIDCEFDGHNGPLISMALVPERDTGLSAYIVVEDAAPADPWVAANIMPILDSHDADLIWSVDANGVGGAIRHALEHCDRPTIIADSPVDIARFCRALSTGSDGQWASADFPAMSFEVHNVDCWPNDLVGGVQHNAWWDAVALRHKLRELTPKTESADDALLREALLREALQDIMLMALSSDATKQQIAEKAHAALKGQKP